MTSNDDVDAKILNAEDQRRQKIMDKAAEIVQIDDSELPQSGKRYKELAHIVERQSNESIGKLGSEKSVPRNEDIGCIKGGGSNEYETGCGPVQIRIQERNPCGTQHYAYDHNVNGHRNEHWSKIRTKLQENPTTHHQ